MSCGRLRQLQRLRFVYQRKVLLVWLCTAFVVVLRLFKLWSDPLNRLQVWEDGEVSRSERRGRPSPLHDRNLSRLPVKSRAAMLEGKFSNQEFSNLGSISIRTTGLAQSMSHRALRLDLGLQVVRPGGLQLVRRERQVHGDNRH